MPTTKPPRPDSVVVNLRMTAAERDTLDALAAQDKRTRSSYVRLLIASALLDRAEALRHSFGPRQKPAQPIEALEGKCPHPRLRRIGDSCALCGEKVGK